MTTIAITVLAILLAALIVKNTKAEIKDFGKEYVDFVKALFTRATLSELTGDLKHVGATLAKAGKQIFRALKLVGFWVALPFLAVLIPVAAALVFAVRAFTK